MTLFPVLIYILSAWVVVVVTHIFLCRLMSRGGLAKAESHQKFLIKLVLWAQAPFLGGLCVIAAARHAGVREIMWAVLYALIVFDGFVYAYFHFFNMSDTGRRVRMLAEVLKNDGLCLGDLERLYSPQDMVRVRVDRLKASGQIVMNAEGRYVVKSNILVKTAETLRVFSKFIRNRER